MVKSLHRESTRMITASSLDTLAAWDAVERFRARYSHHVDDGDWAAWAALFTHDAWYGMSGTEGRSGPEEIAVFGRDVVVNLYTHIMRTALIPGLNLEIEAA